VKSSIDLLADCFRGRPPPDDGWLPVLEIANRGLVTARLALALDDAPGVPEGVRAFLAEVLRRNRLRNEAVAAQLGDVLRRLNAVGVEPVLLKGSSALVAGWPGRREGRILCDLDILVRPHETAATLTTLMASGYNVIRRRLGETPHAVAELTREGGRANIDLHQRPPGPPGMAEIVDLRERARPVEVAGGRALVPDAASQLYLLVLHDQFHDGDYWSGRLNLRHLLDIGDLSQDPALDWARLDSLVRTAVVGNALDTELIDAAWLTGRPITARRAGRLWPRLQHRRRLAQVAWPGLMLPLAALTVLCEAPNLVAHRREIRSGRRRLFAEPRPSAPLEPLADRLGRFKDIFLTPMAGKF
jgi:hypothetical protein